LRCESLCADTCGGGKSLPLALGLTFVAAKGCWTDPPRELSVLLRRSLFGCSCLLGFVPKLPALRAASTLDLRLTAFGVLRWSNSACIASSDSTSPASLNSCSNSSMLKRKSGLLIASPAKWILGVCQPIGEDKVFNLNTHGGMESS